MHAQDALLAGVREGELVRVATRWGSLVARLRISGEMPRGMIFVPIHWSGTFASDARVGALVNPVVDPISGEPEFKHTPARVAPFVVSWQGFVLSRRPVSIVTGRDVVGAWHAASSSALRIRRTPQPQQLVAVGAQAARRDGRRTDWLEYFDAGTRVYRAAHIVADRLEACVFISPRPDLPSRAWLSSLFDRPALDEADRAGLLAGRPTDPRADAGATVCSCYGVGRNTICEAIRREGLHSVEAIGGSLRAGTNCGSCVAEIKGLLEESRQAGVADSIVA